MAMVLPLLPQGQMVAGRQYIHGFMLDAVADAQAIQAINQFVDYLGRQWEAQNISVHGLCVRTNNAVESFHHSLIRRVGRPHPNVWMFVSYLQNTEHSKALDLIRVRRGEQVTVNRRRVYVQLDGTIRK